MVGHDGEAVLLGDHPVTRWPPKMEAGMSWSKRSFICRLVVQQIEVRRPARLKKEDHPFGAGREVGKCPASAARPRLRRPAGVQRRGAEAVSRCGQQLPPRGSAM